MLRHADHGQRRCEAGTKEFAGFQCLEILAIFTIALAPKLGTEILQP